jgi:hypothetical protein
MANNEIWNYLIGTSKELDDLAAKVRRNIHKVDDPRSQALFETSAEVLIGLKHAYDDFLKQKEKVWQ